jgi:hypothetical protein
MSLRSDTVTMICHSGSWKQIHAHLSSIPNAFSPTDVDVYNHESPCVFRITLLFCSEHSPLPAAQWLSTALSEYAPTLIATQPGFTYPPGTPLDLVVAMAGVWGSYQAARMHLLEDPDNSAAELTLEYENDFESIHTEAWCEYG